MFYIYIKKKVNYKIYIYYDKTEIMDKIWRRKKLLKIYSYIKYTSYKIIYI